MSKIKSISFLNGSHSEERDRQHMQYWKKNKFALSDVVDKIRKEGENALESNYAWAYKMATDAHAIATNENLSQAELKESQIDLLNKIKRLNDIINGSMDLDPEKAAFAAVIKVTEENGKEYRINEGIDEKIIDKFKNTVSSLSDTLKVIDARLKNYKIENDIPGMILKEKKEIALFFHYSGLYDFFSSVGLTEVDMAKILAHLSQGKHTGFRGYITEIKAMKLNKKYDEPYFEKETVEHVLNALRSCNLSTKKLEDIYINL